MSKQEVKKLKLSELKEIVREIIAEGLPTIPGSSQVAPPNEYSKKDFQRMRKKVKQMHKGEGKGSEVKITHQTSKGERKSVEGTVYTMFDNQISVVPKGKGISKAITIMRAYIVSMSGKDFT